MEIEKVKSVGPKMLNELKKLGINNSDELINYYPYKYNYISNTGLVDNEMCVVEGIVIRDSVVRYLKNRREMMEFTVEVDNVFVKCIIYNRGYLKDKIKIGSALTLIGKYTRKDNKLMVNELRFESLGNKTIIEPCYHATKSLTSNKINSLINSLGFLCEDVIPHELICKYNFISRSNALQEIHNPTTKLNKAIEHLKYEELFLFMLKINYLKSKRHDKGLKRDVDFKFIDEFINTLPFTLTVDQISCVDEIYKDLTNEKRMNRLLQGDVGSGKTIVSFIALYINYLSGYQGALMAPTEILALQHFENFKKLFPNIRVCLLTGKISSKVKVHNMIKSGEYDVIIGTHALTSEKVSYNNLGLVITDEQHRFGVNQRSVFRNKGIKPDILYMSATPIPRTYAITLFGDMDISVIKTKPSGRKEIISVLKNSKTIKDVLQIMYEQIKKGHQVYVIAPLIEESDKIELENVEGLKNKLTLAFGKICKIGVMHGKLSNKEKEEVMDKFLKNEFQILISTTVIEVGVDVKNATCLVVFDSNRFGLSTLHQLRGRIGRNDLQSYFVMISDNETERLNIMTKTNDGFEISNHDLDLRGSGDLFGIRQSGDMQFKLADLKKDFKLLEQAKIDSLNYINDVNIKKLLSDVSNLD